MSSNPIVRVFADHAEASRAAAELIVAVAAKAIKARGRFLWALAGGGTPEGLYNLLASSGYQERIAWPAGHFFWGDERCVPPEDPGSNYGQAKKLLLDPCSIPAARIDRIKGELAPEEAAADYRQRLAQFAGAGKAWPVLDLALMGLGADGHTASLFPGAPSPGEDRLAAVAVTADYQGRPADRVTLTPPVFNSARNVLFLASGSSKAAAVAAVVSPGADQVKWPAARIQPAAGKRYFFLDQAAAAQL